MCGRYAVTLPPDAMATLFGSADRPNLPPRWNVAPTQSAPMVAIGKAGDRRIISARWGLRPSWMVKDLSTGPLFNARSETIADKPSFAKAFARKRCLIPADGFYEWQRDGKARIPYFVARPDRQSVAFAGIWEAAPDGAGGTMISMAMATCAAPASFVPIHDRFPVVVAPENWADWLDMRTPKPVLRQLLIAPPDGFMLPFQVSDHVNKVANDDEACLAPVRTNMMINGRE
jgi:putative SOS response-associated peptidase YedK